MKKLLKKLAAAISVALVGGSLVAVPVLAQTPSIQEGLDKGTCLNTTDPNCYTQDPETTINDIITDVINIFSILVGVTSVIMIIVGGFKYITSGGDSGNVGSAKNTILFAIVGLVIVALAQVIVKFVLNKVVETNQ